MKLAAIRHVRLDVLKLLPPGRLAVSLLAALGNNDNGSEGVIRFYYLIPCAAIERVLVSKLRRNFAVNLYHP